MADRRAEPLSLADRLAIEELVARYNWAVDTNDVEAYVATFTPDGVFSGQTRQYRGAAELAQMIEERRLQPHTFAQQHLTTNLVLEATEAGASLRATAAILRRDGEGMRIAMMGYYEDELVRLGAGWRFASRTFAAWPPETDPAAPSPGWRDR